MRKGTIRKQAILETAQQLFFEKGYENTSVQDILDVLDLSKGGFYHHFESKLQLLEVICQQQAQKSCERGIYAKEHAGSNAVDQMNALLSESGFFAEDSTEYIHLMLATAYDDSLSQLRERIRQTNMKVLEPALRQVVFEGMQNEVFYPSYPDQAAKLVLLLALDVTDEIAFILARLEKFDQKEGATAEIVELLSAYRDAVERVINAPYGSVELMDIQKLSEIMDILLN